MQILHSSVFKIVMEASFTSIYIYAVLIVPFSERGT